MLKPGTRVYYLPAFTVSDNGHDGTFPGDSVIRRTPNALLVTPPGDETITFSGSAKVTYLPEGGKAFVAPGRPIPAFLRNRTPDEVIQ